MRILVLCPLDEQHSFIAHTLYNKMSDAATRACFPMPVFMEYAVVTGQSKSWEEAIVFALLGVKKLYDISVKDGEDLIVIGNAPKECLFDAVFNFQDIEKSLPYEDLFLKRFREKVINSTETDVIENLLPLLGNLHEASESLLALKNCSAAANFISTYFETDPKIDEIIKQYKDDLEFLKGEDRLLYGNKIK